MYYINKYKTIIEALYWDGSGESAEKIKKYFNLHGEVQRKNLTLNTAEGHFICTMEKGAYIFRDPIGGRPKSCLKKAFENIFSPIFDRHIILIEKIKKEMLIKLQLYAVNDCDWRGTSLLNIYLALMLKCDDLKIEIEKLEFDKNDADFNKIKNAVTEAGTYIAMICDKIARIEKLKEESNEG